MSFFHPLVLMERRLPIIESQKEAAVGCGISPTMSPLEKRKSLRKRLPPWFRTSLPTGISQQRYNDTKSKVVSHGLNTVCEEARCPNVHDCWGKGTATFMIAGDVCTRGCRFCAVGTVKSPPALNEEEPRELAEAVSKMGLSYAVITVVNRDDLPDGGARHYGNCINEIADRSPEVGIELLCSDLDGNLEALDELLDGIPLRVFAHNVECVPRLDKLVRDRRASFKQSLSILRSAKEARPDVMTKTSLMVGLGETDEEILSVLYDLHLHKVDIVTIGQYLSPGPKHLPVNRFVSPSQFDSYRIEGENKLGFLQVISSPLTRSSYHAGEVKKLMMSHPR